MKPAPAGDLALVLHAHLPFLRHPEHRYHLEENWLYEAIAATYLPLCEVFQNLARGGVRLRVTMSMSPTLVSMLRDDLLRERASSYLDRLVLLGEQELVRTRREPALFKLANFYHDRFRRLRALYHAEDGDIPAAFRRLEDQGFVELITVGATHGFQPTILEPAARRAQLEIAAEVHRDAFGRWPRGIWLPECGYVPGVDEDLAELGIRYFFVDTHGVEHARPRPPFGVAAPIYTKSGVAVFGRDKESSRQVWSADDGYPGDPLYRDFYRDIGFDLPLDVIGPFVHPDGIRVHTGFKYHRVTGKVDLGAKQLYDPDRARDRAADHAGNFLGNRGAQIAWLAGRMDRSPIIVSPYDAELFGHWWFEGPQFLDFLFRKLHHDQSIVRATTPSEFLAENPTQVVAEPAPSSWGDGGYSGVWIDGSNDWIYRHQHRAEARMVDLASRHVGGAPTLIGRALDQAARELLLLQSSDWAFILKTGTATGYAASRVKAHAARFQRLCDEVEAARIDEAWLADLERRDNLFPGLDYRVYAR
ncbi:MAG: DUF1957 domain-containing protein [Myxococcales bacterium]|nr:DUF1957 domain-containing protein [Myxococcales bacterium]